MDSNTTCWTVIRGAAAGGLGERDEFARRYGPIVREYLNARWRSPASRGFVDDAVQDVFVECFRQGGVLGRADEDRPGGFRAFLFGVVRNVAARIEKKRARVRRQGEDPLDSDDVSSSEETLSKAFDRAWAKAMVREAAARFESRVAAREDGARQRAEILRLRFFEGIPIRDIARRWQVQPSVLHHQYARARDEFRAVLLEVLAHEHPGRAADLDRHCSEVLGVLDRS